MFTMLRELILMERDPDALGPLVRRLERDPNPEVMRKAMSVLYKSGMYRECQILVEIYGEAGFEMNGFVERTRDLLGQRGTFSYMRLREAMLAQAVPFIKGPGA